MKQLELVVVFCTLFFTTVASSECGCSSSSSSKESQEKCKDPNAVWSDCASACPKTCSNWWQNIKCFACRPGCTCKENYVLNENNNRCVKISKCPKPVCEDPRREWRSDGTACPPACPGVYDNVRCTDQIVVGCFCRDGYIEDGNGNCVEPSCCPEPVCNDPRREYTDCGSACPPSCKNLNETSVPCIEVCVPGCFCKFPYVEDGNGNCVDTCECPPPVCSDPNRHYESCGTACPETCSNDLIVCSDECVSGCFCNKGLVEDGNGNCICKDDCNKCSDPNREYKECGTACPDTCDNINDVNRVCTLQCVSGCFCKYPLIEDANGKCIDRKNCPNPTCSDPNRYYTTCGPSCLITCKNRCDVIYCPLKRCVEGCFCRPGLIDDGYGNCIDPNTCPEDACKCPGNAQWTNCGTCDGTCDNPNPICPKVCKEGCYCQKGQVRNANNVCIPKEQCPGY